MVMNAIEKITYNIKLTNLIQWAIALSSIVYLFHSQQTVLTEGIKDNQTAIETNQLLSEVKFREIVRRLERIENKVDSNK